MTLNIIQWYIQGEIMNRNKSEPSIGYVSKNLASSNLKSRQLHIFNIKPILVSRNAHTDGK